MRAEFNMIGLMVGMALVGLCVAGFMIFATEGAELYGVTYSNESVEAYNQIQELNDQSQELQDEITSVGERTGVLDVIGSIFSSGYAAALTQINSVRIFNIMLDTGLNQAGLDSRYSTIIKSTLITLLLAAIV